MTLRRIVAVGLLIAAICTAVVWRYSGFGDGSPCEHRSRIVAHNGAGDTVEFAEDYCAGPAFSNEATLSLIRANGRRFPFFQYQQSKPEPVVHLDGSRIVLFIAKVEDIASRKLSVDGVPIEYHIGEFSKN